jgi:hypothetical protein
VDGWAGQGGYPAEGPAVLGAPRRVQTRAERSVTHCDRPVVHASRTPPRVGPHTRRARGRGRSLTVIEGEVMTPREGGMPAELLEGG